MRNLLLLLLLANVLYYMWGSLVAEPNDNGIVLISESDLGPPLQLADAKSISSAVENSESMATTRSSELEVHVGRSCVTLGPLRESSEADGALAELEDEGLQGTVRATEGEVFVGHWVQIRDIPDRTSANEMLSTLKSGGLGEAYIVETPEEGIRISLGLFGDLSGAERIELQAKSMGLPAEITARMRAATVFYVDIGLPPGRGASSLIERYGEDRVLLRDAATCPRDN